MKVYILSQDINDPYIFIQLYDVRITDKIDSLAPLPYKIHTRRRPMPSPLSPPPVARPTYFDKDCI